MSVHQLNVSGGQKNSPIALLSTVLTYSTTIRTCLHPHSCQYLQNRIMVAESVNTIHCYITVSRKVLAPGCDLGVETRPADK